MQLLKNETSQRKLLIQEEKGVNNMQTTTQRGNLHQTDYW